MINPILLFFKKNKRGFKKKDSTNKAHHCVYKNKLLLNKKNII